MGAFLFPRIYLAMSGNILGCHSWGLGVCTAGANQVEARNTAKQFIMHKNCAVQNTDSVLRLRNPVPAA